MNSLELLEAMTSIDGSLIENARPKLKKRGKTLAKLVLVAALIATLAMSALASEEIANWFKSYFAQNSPTGLTENQIAFIEENTTTISKSQTCNGYTVEVDSAFSDGSYSIIKLKLIAPEGVNLDAVNYFPGNDSPLLPTGEEHLIGWNGGWGCYVDDAAPNMAEIICTIREGIDNRTNWILRIEDIYGTYEENIGTENYRQWTELVIEGIWEFPIVFSNDGNQEIELINDPIPGQVNIGLNKDYYEDVTITSILLRAMSAEITYEFLESVHGSGEFDPIYLVMKDGTEVMFLPKSGHPGRSTYHFRAPIILSDADYVLMPDGIKLPIP